MIENKMKNNISTAAILLAAGSSSRFDKTKLKQYELINNKAIIYHSTKPFLNNKIDIVLVVINKLHKSIAKSSLKELKRIKFINGGSTRQESVFKALVELKKYKPNKVLIHDSARPNISRKIINDIINYLDKYDSAIPVIKINDALKKINKSNYIIENLNKDSLILAQTPQGFNYKTLLKAHSNTKIINANDDSVLLDNKKKIYTFTGDYQNIKITTKSDLSTIKAIMNLKEKKYISVSGLGIDVHKFGEIVNKNTFIKIGGIKIKYNKNLIGHSDADVLIHSLVDSILGTIADGDIGSKFSNTDDRWKKADSKIFLDFALEKLRLHNSKIIHTDVTIICEKPKISPHRNKIRNNLSKLINIHKKNISIKATTTEGLGYLGREEGIMVKCLTTISREY